MERGFETEVNSRSQDSNNDASTCSILPERSVYIEYSKRKGVKEYRRINTRKGFIVAKTQIEILIETKEVFVVRRKRNFIRRWCHNCESNACHTSPLEAGLLTGIDEGTILALIERNTVHASNYKGAGSLVCLRSLCLA